MKHKTLINAVLTIGILFSSIYLLKAVRAYPDPIKIIQPDGSSLTIQIHGDEFISWSTWNDYLVVCGKDGYYYFAKYNKDGDIISTGYKVSKGNISNAVIAGNPHASMVRNALIMRKNVQSLREQAKDFKMPYTKVNERPRFLVLLMQFEDRAFTYDKNNFDKMLNWDSERGYTHNGATGSVRKYFYDNSLKVFDPEFIIMDPVTVNRSASSFPEKYDGLDTCISTLVIKNKEKIEAAGFKIEKSGKYTFVRNMFVFFAGYNQSQGAANTIWPHAMGHYYACTSELKGNSGNTLDGIGTYCHEFGHTLGLPDFYDTDGKTDGKSNGLGRYSLMSNGPYNNKGNTPPYLNIEELRMIGWGSDPEILENRNYTMEPYAENRKAYKALTSNTGGYGEYFIFENRQQTGWDAYIPGHGLLVYHVDKSLNMVNGKTAKERWDHWNNINAFKDHQCMDIVEASEEEDNNSFAWTFPGSSGKKEFSSESIPASKDWAGNNTGYNLYEISENNDIGTISFKVSKNVTFSLTGFVKNNEGQPVKGAAIRLIKLKNDTPATKAENPDYLFTTTTGSDGSYGFESEMPSGKYSVSISADGYIDLNKIFNEKSGKIIENFTLNSTDYQTVTLKKYSVLRDITSSFGTSDRYFAIKYSGAELAPYKGKIVKSISFMLIGSDNSTAESGVFIFYDNKIKHIKKIPETKIYGNYENNALSIKGDINIADMQDENFIINEGKTLYFGFYVKNIVNSNYMLYEGKTGNNGMMVSSDGKYWQSYNGAISVSVALTDPEQLNYTAGNNFIDYIYTDYSDGDMFTLRLINSSIAPVSQKWYLDGIIVAEDSGKQIVLKAGKHSIRAELTYKDGSSEILFQEINVK